MDGGNVPKTASQSDEVMPKPMSWILKWWLRWYLCISGKVSRNQNLVDISMEQLANSWLFIRGIRSSPWDVLLGLWMVVHGAGSSECNHTSHIPTDHLQIMQVWLMELRRMRPDSRTENKTLKVQLNRPYFFWMAKSSSSANPVWSIVLVLLLRVQQFQGYTGKHKIAVAVGGKTSLSESIGCLWWHPWRR
jgi:hypothetical protein